MGAAQQVEQCLVVVLAGVAQRGAALVELALEIGRRETLFEQLGAGQFVNHTRVQHKVARRPARGAEQAQQPLMHIRALQQQCQVALAAQQRLNPVHQAQRRRLRDPGLPHPQRAACQQAQQARTRVLAQCQHPRVLAPAQQPGAQIDGQLFQQFIKIRRAGVGFGAVASVALFVGTVVQQRVELLRHQFAVAVELVQQLARGGVSHAVCNPLQIGVLRRQHMGLLIVQVLDAVLDTAQELIGQRQRLGRAFGHQAGLAQAR